MHTVGPYSQDTVTLTYSRYLLIETVKIKPMSSLGNSYQVNRVALYIGFLCRKHFIHDVVSVESMFQLTFACIACYYIFKVFTKPYGGLSITSGAVPRHILVWCYITQKPVENIWICGSRK